MLSFSPILKIFVLCIFLFFSSISKKVFIFDVFEKYFDIFQCSSLFIIELFSQFKNFMVFRF